MKLKAATIKDIMRNTTNRPITGKSVFKMMEMTEEYIKATTSAAEKLLEEQNQIRKLQGLREKVRLSEEEIEEVINGHQKK